jgi:hypothetical protein
MKKLTKTLLTATLILGLPLGAYAASEAVHRATDPGHGDRLPHGRYRHDGRQASWRPPRQDGPHEEHDPGTDPAHLQQRYDKIEDPAKKAEFVKNLGLRADGMIKRRGDEAVRRSKPVNQSNEAVCRSRPVSRGDAAVRRSKPVSRRNEAVCRSRPVIRRGPAPTPAKTTGWRKPPFCLHPQFFHLFLPGRIMLCER